MWVQRHEREAVAMRRRQRYGVPSLHQVRAIEYRQQLDEIAVYITPGGRHRAVEEYPDCPLCGARTEWFFSHRDIARLRCRGCAWKETRKIVIVAPPKRLHPVICLYCEAVVAHVEREQLMRMKHQRGGFHRKCSNCDKWFTQGGRSAWRFGRALLLARVKQLNLPKPVADTVIAMAACDVLMGLAYCHNVELRTAEAWREASTTNRGVLEFHENAISNSVRSGLGGAG